MKTRFMTKNELMIDFYGTKGKASVTVLEYWNRCGHYKTYCVIFVSVKHFDNSLRKFYET